MQKEKLVLIDNGVAEVCTLDELLKLAPDIYKNEIFSAELLRFTTGRLIGLAVKVRRLTNAARAVIR